MASDKCMGISTNPAAAGRAKSGGKIDAVSGTVQRGAEFSTDPFLYEISRNIEEVTSIFSFSDITSAADFENRLRHWQMEDTARIQEGELAAFPKLSYIVQSKVTIFIQGDHLGRSLKLSLVKPSKFGFSTLILYLNQSQLWSILYGSRFV